MSSPGRNDPCPCGSGRKFKHCCLEKGRIDDIARVRVRRAEARVVDAVSRWALRRFGRPFFEHALGDFFCREPPDGSDIADLPEFEAMFMPWFATLFVRDPHDEMTQPDWPDEPLAVHWARTERPALDDLEREWIAAAAASPMSAFAVERVERGQNLDIRDLLTGRRFHVLEQSASMSLHQGDLIFTRVVTAGGISLMFGMAPFSFPPDWQLPIIEWRDTVFRRHQVSRADLADFDIEIRDHYFDFAEKGAQSPASDPGEHRRGHARADDAHLRPGVPNVRGVRPSAAVGAAPS